MKVVRENYSEGCCGNCGKRVGTRHHIVDNDGDTVIALCHKCLVDLLDALMKRE